METPRGPLRPHPLTNVRPLAAALILSLAPASGVLPAGAGDPARGCADAGAAGAVDAGACGAPADQTAPPPTAVSSAPPGAPTGTAVNAPAAAEIAASAPPGVPPGAPSALAVPNTAPAATPVDEPLPRDGTAAASAATPAGAAPEGALAPSPRPDPMPVPQPLVMTPVEPPGPPPAPAGGPAGAGPAVPLLIDPLSKGGTGLPSWMGPSPGAAGRAGATTRLAGSRADQSRLYAGLPWEQCGLRARGRGRPGFGALGAPAPASGVPVEVAADRADYDRAADVVTLYGHIVIDQDKQHLEADRSRYDHQTGAVNATGNVFLDYPGGRLLADQGDYNLESEQGRLANVSYRLASGINARGTAATAELLPAQISRFRDVIYTTCPPGYSDWSIRASELELDQVDGMGTARHARLRLGPVPILYTPYLRFPIDDRRRSGFLIPVIGSSSNTGLDLTVPYYWNIAPNLDATLAPRLMSSRGLMLGAEVRGLAQFGKLEFNGEVLPHDEDEPEAGVRWGERVTGTATWGRFASAIDYSAVSDDSFLTDFGNRLDVTSIRNLTQVGTLSYGGNGYGLTGIFQGFQTVDPTTTAANRPYSQLPHVQLDLAPQHWGPAEFTFQAHYDYFDNPAKVYGNRAVLLPTLRLPLRRSFGFLIPRVRLYATGYRLINTDSGTDPEQSFLIPSLDLDAGLLFDRDISLFGHTGLQTLEPRIYYVLTSYADQSQTPLFDTTALTFSYASLFRPNRFTGYDRVGDDNRITIGLTSRTLGAADGREWLRISLGQILYFSERRVQLTGTTAETASSSSLAGELSTNPAEGWLARASFQWDPNLSQNQWEQRVLQLRYAPGDDRMLNLTYRYSLGATEAERYENTDLSFYWPITKRIGVVGRWLYSVLDSDTVEAFGGIEFGRCCWRLRLLGRHLKTSATDPGSTGFMLQLELAGLGTIGDKVESLLKQGIYGYDSQ